MIVVTIEMSFQLMLTSDVNTGPQYTYYLPTLSNLTFD